VAAQLLRTLAVICVLAGGTFVSRPALSAQEAGAGAPEVATSPSTSDLWWTASAALQGSRLTCDLCETGRDLGPALGFGIGAHASASVRVGLDGSFATTMDDGARESIYGAGVVAELHPRPTSGLHLIGGLGWAGYRAGDFSYDALRLRLDRRRALGDLSPLSSGGRGPHVVAVPTTPASPIR